MAQADKLDLARISSLLARFENLHLLVAGDVLLDEYLVGDVDRISPEAPVPVVRVHSESLALGGAGNVVRNVAALGARCTFCSSVGTDAEGDRVLELLEALGVATDRVNRRNHQVLAFGHGTPVPERGGVVGLGARVS